MTGPAGCGKTCAALCLCDYTKPPVVYYTVAGLCSDLIDAEKGRLETSGVHPVTISPRELRQNIAQANLCVLDELGAREKVSDFHYEAVKMVLDAREGLPLFVVSNLSMNQIAEIYDDRIASRLAGGTVIDASNEPDLRLAEL